MSVNNPKYRIGHPAYGGSNRANYCATVKDVEKEMAAQARYGKDKLVWNYLRNRNNAPVELFIMPVKKEG